MAQNNANPEMQDAFKALGALMGANTNQPVISQAKIKELLPAEFEGLKRTASESGKNAAFGMNVSYAMATYSKDAASITVKISDISAMGQFMKMAQFAWTQTEMERESETGFERTSKIDGQPAQESYQYAGKSGEIKVMVDGRFMVEINGDGVEMDSMRTIIKAVDLNKLMALKPEPAP
jgi:hypothetical protein